MVLLLTEGFSLLAYLLDIQEIIKIQNVNGATYF